MVLSSNWSTNIGDFGKFMSIILGLYVGKHHMLYHHTDKPMEEKLKIVRDSWISIMLIL